MTDREVVITHLDDLRLFADVTVHPVVSPDNWDVYSSLCDYIDQIKTEVEILLKEQEAVEPVLDEQTGRIWLCGKCGSYVGFEDNDPHDPNEFDKYCRDCGTPVLWKGR